MKLINTTKLLAIIANKNLIRLHPHALVESTPSVDLL